MTNEAADGVRYCIRHRYLSVFSVPSEVVAARMECDDCQDLAAERKATVERIRAALVALGHVENPPDDLEHRDGDYHPIEVGWGTLESNLAQVLDAEAAR